jgi:hypothetical protein
LGSAGRAVRAVSKYFETINRHIHNIQRGAISERENFFFLD